MPSTKLNRKNNWGRGPLLFYVPDEIHVLLDEPYPAPDGLPADEKALGVEMEKRYTALLDGLVKTLPAMAQAGEFSPEAIAQRVTDRTKNVAVPGGDTQPTEQESLQDNDQRSAAAPAPPALPDLLPLLVDDLMPDSRTLDFLKTSAASLQRLSIPDDVLIPGRGPWMVLPDGISADRGQGGGSGRRLRSLHFFQIGPDRMRTAVQAMDAALSEDGVILARAAGIATIQQDTDERVRRVRDLVNLVNLFPDMLRGAPNMPNHFLAAMPNWLCDATCGGCPCPGSAPAPIPPERLPNEGGFWSFRFSTNDALEDLVEEQRKIVDTSDVIIAVLDASPTLAEIRGAAGRGGQFANNMLLQHVNEAAQAIASKGARKPPFGNITIDNPADGSLPRGAFTVLDGMAIEWRQKGEPYNCNPVNAQLKTNDHGLFITGIVHDIAPRAETHLIRVLSEYGVTHTGLLLPVLQGLPARFLDGEANKNKRLIINMSLGWSIPPGVEQLRRWLAGTFGALAPQLGQYDNLDDALAALQASDPAGIIRTIKAILDDLHAPIRETIAFLNNADHKDRILIVAAAGNDNYWFDRLPNDPVRHRPEPRWPARYDKVVGVAAVGFADRNAYYSNRADIGSQSNGVATFGGDAIRMAHEDLGEIDTYPDKAVAVYGPTAMADDARVDAVKGIYISDPVMLNGGPNKTGWVYWSGTSFATPVITGIAANLWAKNPALLPAAIIAEFAGTPATKGVSPTDEGPLDTLPRDRVNLDTLDCPKIFAKQVWKEAILTDPLHHDIALPHGSI
ncbi:MAG: S8/S53 family peptidase [Chloroflexota bacterium]|nr:S8/S53 family peptidase [Chloroflexota bacterium]